MARDEVLYTGSTSASYAKARKIVENEEKLKAQAQILPQADVILREIAKHKENIAKELGNIIHIEMEAEDVKSTVLGLKLADSKMTLLETRIRSILSAKPLKTRKKESENV